MHWISKLPKIIKDFFQYFADNSLNNKIPIGIDIHREILNIKGKRLNVSNEECRLMMFVYISIINYLLKDDVIFLYHCKSGQDRTGTFFAIEQTVIEIMKSNFDKKNSNTFKNDFNTMNFFDFYNKYFRTDSSIIRDEIYNLYAKYLLFSYSVTMTSTGFPGLKWNLSSGLTANNFPYLMLKNPEEVLLFEGASKLRGS